MHQRLFFMKIEFQIKMGSDFGLYYMCRELGFVRCLMNLPELMFLTLEDMSRPMGKPTICIGENKDADQLRGNREADQRLCFRYMDSTIHLLVISKTSSI